MKNYQQYWKILSGGLLIIVLGASVFANPVTFSPEEEQILIGENSSIVMLCLLVEALVVSGLLTLQGGQFLSCFVMTIVINILNYAGFYRYLNLDVPFSVSEIIVVEGIIVIVETICVVAWALQVGMLWEKRGKRIPFLLMHIVPIVCVGNALSFSLSLLLGEFLWSGGIDIMSVYGVLTILVYCALLLSSILWTLKKIFKLPPPDHQAKNSLMGIPIFQTARNYLGPLWTVCVLGGISLVFATNRLNNVLRAERLVYTLFIIVPYSLLLVLGIRSLLRRMATWRHEKPGLSTHVKKVYFLGIMVSVILYLVYQEPYPLKKYGVQITWYRKPIDEPELYYSVYFTRNIHGQSLSGPLCGDKIPDKDGGGVKITLSDENGDSIEDILIHTRQGKEIGVLSIVEPYIPGQAAFTFLRGGEDGCFVPLSNPPYENYHKVNWFF
jgi:hypothetical protein